MATNHTTNYQLNLWEPGDSFLREEFNQNNQKLDAALGELSTRCDTLAGGSKLVSLLDVEDPGTGDQIDLDVSTIQWGQWFRLFLVLKLAGSGYALLRFNNQSSGASYVQMGGTTSYTGGLANVAVSGSDYYTVIQFTPAWNAARFVYALGLEGGISYGQCSNLRYQDLQTLNLALSHESYYFSPGSRIQLLGLK